MKARSIILCVASLGLAPAALVAHHGFEMFDQKNPLTLQGTVKDWQWANPHTRILLEVQQNGKPVVWNLEGISISQLGHMGWKRELLKIGDTVTIEIFPLRNGKPGGQWSRVYDARGKEIGVGAATGESALPGR